ncbi:flagellar hook-associated protein [Cryobacterium sp. Hh11]|uniref:flagellar filament capping protein FliD n=1 Tax=Cryobacterium sp. Hh11 TaxID=2555868 RepID=UPI00106989E0|nr:flagellar filament capping protein FliD [Cryobacterium sp. Hh11]TFD51401.1 flagellar hook-associated protein [Cryobacterium sp. Hh11]
MSLAIDGLVSGLDTTSLINSLMQLEAVPQSLLKSKVSESQTFITALQGLNSAVASLATTAATAAKSDSLDLFSASSSSSKLTATVATGASASQIDIVVDRTAQSQVSVSDAMPSWPGANFTITSASGGSTFIGASSGNLDDVVAAVNSADAGVKAVKVSAGTVDGVPQFRLQFTATSTGAASAFTITQPTNGTAATTDPAMTGLTTTRTAEDAAVTLWAGTSAAQTITSSTNNFENLLPGVSVTVSGASTDPISLTVARNTSGASKIAETLVSSLNTVFANISTKSAVVNSTDSGGNPIVSGGVFTGDSSVRDVGQRLLLAASMPVNGRSPSEIGISITRNGTMEFDSAKFSAALIADPEAVQATLTEIASRVEAAAKSASDKYDGQITSRITGQESMVKDLGSQIENWDLRLASRRSGLERTYSALEVQLSALNSQQDWLTSQIASLPSYNSGK